MKRVLLRFWIVLLLGIGAYSGFCQGQMSIAKLENEIAELESEIALLETRVSQLERSYEYVSNILSRMNTTPDPRSSPPAEVLDLGSLDSSLTSAQEGREGIEILWDDPSQGREPTYTPRPEIPPWVSEQALRLQVVVSFELTAEGVLRNVKVERGSGYPEVDAAVLEALRRWRFRPVSSTRTVTGRVPYTIIPGLRSLDSPSPPTSQAAPTGEPWKDKQNWRRLQLGMSTDAVVRILGDPERINKDPVSELWDYPGGGYVVFWDE